MEFFTHWIIVLISLIVLTRVAAHLSRRLDLPGVTIQLLIGVLLGPSLFDLLGSPIVLGTWGSPSPNSFHAVLKILAEIGLIQLMFLAGLQVEWRELKGAFTSFFSTGFWGFVFVATAIAIVSRFFVSHWAEALGVSAVLAGSSFGISFYNLREMKLLDFQASRIVIGVGLLGSLLAILLMVASLATHYVMAHGGFKMVIAVSWFLGKLVMFSAISYFLMSRFLGRMNKTNFQKRPRQMLFGYILLVAALYAWAAMHFGSFAAVGVASLAGVFLGIFNIELKEKISKGFESAVASIPVGIFFAVLGMEVNFKETEGHIPFLVLLFVAIIGAKWLGYWIALRRNSDLVPERSVILFGGLPQGETGILIAAYLFSRGVVTPRSFNAAISGVVLLTMLAPIFLRIASRKVNGVPSFARGDDRHHRP